MSRYSDSDPYLNPATGVLRNRLDIADEAGLEQAEADLVAARSYELSQTPVNGRFDLAHPQAIHRYLFGDLYEWAGELRTIDIGKGGNQFAHHAFIASAAAPIFGELAQEKHLAGLGASTLLFGLKPWDPMSLAGTAVLLALVVVVASLIPSLRAANVNPIDSLRAE